MPRDTATGGLIAPGIAAALCIQPRSLLNARQTAKVDVLKDALPEFAIMRRLAIGFRTLLRAGTSGGLDRWLRDAAASGVYTMQRFARTLNQDIDAVRNAVTKTWSNGQTEGQINRLKMLKRAMYGKAGAELLRARILSWSTITQHQAKPDPLYGTSRRVTTRFFLGAIPTLKEYRQHNSADGINL